MRKLSSRIDRPVLLGYGCSWRNCTGKVKVINPKMVIQRFLRTLPFPVLKAEHVECLEAPISLLEIKQAIKQAKTCSAPGLDGFQAIYYRNFEEELAPQLEQVYEAIRKGDMLDPEMNRVLLSLILKWNKDPGEVGSYWPILLINNDFKLLAKVLVSRIKIFIAQCGEGGSLDPWDSFSAPLFCPVLCVSPWPGCQPPLASYSILAFDLSHKGRRSPEPHCAPDTRGSGHWALRQTDPYPQNKEHRGGEA